MAGKKLLVADDSLTIQKVIRLALSNEGYDIQAVSDGNDAIEQISVFRPDVILIDVSLPGKTAFEVKRAINEHQDLEEVRFILLSSAFEKVDEAQAEEVKFHGRLTKPFDPAHLRQVLHDALEQVTALRREPTSLLPRPPAPPENFEMAESDNDDWLSQPISPEQPILAPPSPESSTELWDHEPELMTLPPEITSFTRPPAPPLPPAPPSAPPPTAAASAPLPPQAQSSPDSDIKHLTESTIRMSGLDDFEWSVNEPSLKPPASMLDTGNSSFQIEPPSSAYAPPPPPFRPEPQNEYEPSIRMTPPPQSDLATAASPADFYRDAEEERQPSQSFNSSIPSMLSHLQPEQIEELIRKELRETFQRMAEKILPEVAEKVIKQEIHRMLSEP